MDPRVAANRARWDRMDADPRALGVLRRRELEAGRLDLLPLLVEEVGDVDFDVVFTSFGALNARWPPTGCASSASTSPWVPWKMFPFMVEAEPGIWRLPEPDDAGLPLRYSLKATRA